MIAKVYARDEIMPVESRGGYNPNPVFPQWNGVDIYPNLFWGSLEAHTLRRPFRMLYLENRYVKVCCNADIGGRVWSIYDKLAQRHAINYASGVLSYNSGFGKNYTCGGMEINYPLAHAPTTRCPREYRIFQNEDGSASIMIGEYEQTWRTRWSIQYTLRPDRSFLEMTVRLYNRTPVDTRYMFWANCGIPVNDQTEYIFPERAGSMHGLEKTTFSWPIWQGRDISQWKNGPEPLGLYMLDAQEPYFGYYDHGADCGLVHYADLADLPGKKYWSWGGAGFFGRVHALHSHHPDKVPYGEIQAGRIVIQEHRDRVPPETEQQWTEYWYSVRGTGSFNGAGRDAVLHAELAPAKSDHFSKVKITILGTGTFSGVSLAIDQGNRPRVSSKEKITLSPETVVCRDLAIPYKPDEKESLIITAYSREGNVLGQARVNPPRTRDSWTEIISADTTPKTISTEERFLEGERLARDWFYHDVRTKYEEALKQDPGLSSAHIENGKIDLSQGCYETAIQHLNQALKRKEDSLDARYFLGVALEFSGQFDHAQKNYELSSRYDYEGRSLVRLAELRMRKGDFHHALRYLERVRDIAGRLTRPRALLAACLRRLGRKGEALAEIQAARQVDPMDPFLQFEEMFITRKKGNVRPLLEQVRRQEPPILESAFDYGNAGLLAEALFVVKTLPKPGPLAMFYTAWLEKSLGHELEAKKSLRAACRLDPVGHCAWRLEMIPVLEWAIKSLPKEPRTYYHLGNLLMSHNRSEEAWKMWQRAERLGDKCYLLYSTMGYYKLNMNKDNDSALRYFRKAESLNPVDLYVKFEIVNILHGRGKYKEIIRYLTAQPKVLKRSCALSYCLLSAYLETRDYDRFDEFCAACEFHDRRQINSPAHLWTTRHIQEGLELLSQGRYKCALSLLERAETCPSNLGLTHEDRGKNERLLYHIGRCYEKLGDIPKAREYWRCATSVEHFQGWEPASCYKAWSNRYYQALAHKKLGDHNQAEIIFDALDVICKTNLELPYHARKQLMNMILYGRFAPEEFQDPSTFRLVQVGMRAEL